MKSILFGILAFLLLASVGYSQRLGNRKAVAKGNSFKGKVVQICAEGGIDSGCKFYLENNNQYFAINQASYSESSLFTMKDQEVEIFGFQMLDAIYASQIKLSEKAEVSNELPPVETDWRVLFVKFGYKNSPIPEISDEEVRSQIQYAFQTYKSYFPQLTLSEIVIKSTTLDKDMSSCTSSNNLLVDSQDAAEKVGLGNSNIVLGYGSNTNCQSVAVGQVKLTRQGDQAYSAYSKSESINTLASIGHEIGHSKHNLQHGGAYVCDTNPVIIPQNCQFSEFGSLYTFMSGSDQPILTKVEQYIIASQFENNSYKKQKLILDPGESKTVILRRDLDKSIRPMTYDILEIDTGGEFNYFVEFKPRFHIYLYLYGLNIYVGPPIDPLRPDRYKLVYFGEESEPVLNKTVVDCFADKPGEIFRSADGLTIKPRCDISLPQKMYIEVSRQ